jgi:hypothetical protein
VWLKKFLSTECSKHIVLSVANLWLLCFVHPIFLFFVVIEQTFGLAEQFGWTSTVRFGPNDRTFFCRTQNFFSYYSSRFLCTFLHVRFCSVSVRETELCLTCSVLFGQNGKTLLRSVSSFLVFWSLQLRDFLSGFFSLAHIALQNVNKDYIIFSYFCN